MDTIDVLYTADHNYVNYMLVSIYSLLENNPGLNIRIHIIYEKFTMEDFLAIDNVVKRFNNTKDLLFYNFNIIKGKIEQSRIRDWKGTKIANARLFFSDVIKDAKKLLYTDSDTIVTGSIKELLNHSGTVCMVKDMMPKHIIKQLDSELKDYYNSGIILADVDKWHKNDCDRLIADALIGSEYFQYPDQDVLNKALKHLIETLHPKFNLFSIDLYYDVDSLFDYYKRRNIERYTKEEMEEAKACPSILHETPITTLKTYIVTDTIHPCNLIHNQYKQKIDRAFVPIKNNRFGEQTLSDIGMYVKAKLPTSAREIIKKGIKIGAK